MGNPVVAEISAIPHDNNQSIPVPSYVLNQSKSIVKQKKRNERKYVCSKCEAIFTKNISLKLHEYQHKNITMNYDYCSEQFEFISSYNRHMRSHHPYNKLKKT
jgi:hypothetical protein